MIEKGDAPGGQLLLGQRGQDNFKLAANFGYGSRGSADPRESLRKRRILKLVLNAHKVLSEQKLSAGGWFFNEERERCAGVVF